MFSRRGRWTPAVDEPLCNCDAAADSELLKLICTNDQKNKPQKLIKWIYNLFNIQTSLRHVQYGNFTGGLTLPRIWLLAEA